MLSKEQIQRVHNCTTGLLHASLENNEFHPMLKELEAISKQLRQYKPKEDNWVDIVDHSSQIKKQSFFTSFFEKNFSQMNKEKMITKKNISEVRTAFSDKIQAFYSKGWGYKNLRIMEVDNFKVILRYSVAHNEFDTVGFVFPLNNETDQNLCAFLTGNETMFCVIQGKTILYTKVKEAFHMHDTSGDHYHSFTTLLSNEEGKVFSSFIKDESQPYKNGTIHLNDTQTAIYSIVDNAGFESFYAVKNPVELKERTIIFYDRSQESASWEVEEHFDSHFKIYEGMVNNPIYEVWDTITETKKHVKNLTSGVSIALYPLNEKKHLAEMLELCELNFAY